MNNEHTSIVAVDAGGTNIRVAYGLLAHGRFTISIRTCYKTENFSSMNPVLEDFFKKHKAGKPEIIALCGAGPVKNDYIAMSNANFSISKTAIQNDFCSQVLLMNDFSAMTWGILEDYLHEMHQHELIHGEAVRNTSPIIALGPGTGLGFGYAVFTNEKPLVFASEGGHTALPVWDETTARLAVFTVQRYPDGCDAEKLISGPGIALLYEFVTEGRLHDTVARLPYKEQPARITELALTGDTDARTTIELFISLLARFCAEAAATFLPQGIFITGGVAQKIKPLFSTKLFSDQFCASWAPSLTPVLSKTPVYLAGSEDTALYGLAFAGAVMNNLL